MLKLTDGVIGRRVIEQRRRQSEGRFSDAIDHRKGVHVNSGSVGLRCLSITTSFIPSLEENDPLAPVAMAGLDLAIQTCGFRDWVPGTSPGLSMRVTNNETWYYSDDGCQIKSGQTRQSFPPDHVPPMWTDKNGARSNRNHLKYPSDVTDNEWAHVEPLIPPPAAAASGELICAPS